MDELPLTGVSVVELGDNVAAPFCGQILGDLGADVVKIERPGPGDPARQWEAAEWDGYPPSFAALNRNKRSAVVDLKDPESLLELKNLIRYSDVFLHNLRPGSENGFGLDGAALLEANPKLVYCALGAFGHRGPLAHHPGYDPLMQAFGGIMSVTGESGGGSVRVGVPMIDCSAGMWAAVGILAALNGRSATGQGSIVNTSLYETSLAFMTLVSAMHMATGRVAGRMGSGAQFTVPFRAYGTADGELILGCANDRLFARLCTVLGHPEWVDDARMRSNVARVQNRGFVDDLIAGVLKVAPRAEWQSRFDAAGIPNAPLQDIAEVHSHAQTDALGMLVQGQASKIRVMGLPLSFNDARPGIRRDPPEHGQHTAEVFGRSAKE